MPRHSDYVAVAETLTERLEHRAFMTLPRRDITAILRNVSGEPRTRIKALIAQDLTDVMRTYGLNFQPPLADTDTRDYVRLYREDSVIGTVINIITNPSPETDAQLGAALKKIKGHWNWHREEQPIAS